MKLTTSDGHEIHYLDEGSGDPILLLHGSGPGVSAEANWSKTVPSLASSGFRAIAPDIVGFGQSSRPTDFDYSPDGWAQSIRQFMESLGLDRAHLVGNSMGGRIAITLAARRPEAIRSLSLMGVRSPTSDASGSLANVRAYEPDRGAMRDLLTENFVTDKSLVSDELIEARYQASAQPGEHAHYRRMFAHPGANGLPLSVDDIRGIEVRTLLMHGREDKVIPLVHTLELIQLLPVATAVIFGNCGHWVQIEKAREFEAQLEVFVNG